MGTIKSLVLERLQQKGEVASCERVGEIVAKLLAPICKLLPDGTPEGNEYVKILSKSMDIGMCPSNLLVKKVVDERDDLCDYPCLRQRLECAINDWK